MPIRVLSEVVAAQIAAGEVVERPASVVKELMENTLDAGATSVTVDVTQGGKRLIRVSDDGHGIPAAEAELAFARHSTSKLSTVEDLDHIRTLGFRGEALASIASVSRVTMVTRHRDETAGAEVLVEGGEVQHTRPAGAPAGTVITVENLFFNTPARLKFLKAESTERKHINTLVTRYAMAYPAVRFRLVQEGREQFHSTGSGDLADVLVEVFGLDVFREMVEVSPQPPPRPDVPPVEVYGFASTPALSRSDRGHIVLFVNGRVISDQSLTYAVMQAYRDLLPQRRYPLAVLLITLPPEEVDVNVHPTKAEVRFRVPDMVFAAVQRAVRAALSGQAPAEGSDFGDPYRTAEPAWGGRSSARNDLPTPTYPARRPVVPGEEQLRLELETLDPGRYVRSQEEDYSAIPAGPGQPARPRTLPILRVVGQVGAMYIVAEGPAGLYLIDQHAAHARVIYEALVEGESLDRRALQGVTVQFPSAAAVEFETVLATAGETLDALGFEIEPFGGATFRVRVIPALLVNEDPQVVLSALVDAAQDETGDSGVLSLNERLIRQVSVLVAYKAGQTLDYDAMQGLIQQLERCESPRADPYGRPTLLHISGADLAKQFGR
ncbi:MAG: DNA mismatch repair endonuclease MutL [Anaerolineae bacterium]|nr:DNA mismatch repair endonuclease MutL [Anaerolineae bacterium]